MNNIKKITLTLALAAAIIGGGSIFANPKKEKQNTPQPTTTCTQQCNNTDPNCNPQDDPCLQGNQRHCKKPNNPQCDRGGKGHKPGGMMKKAFQGIELTQAQKDSIHAISQRQHAKMKTEERKIREEMMANTQAEIQQVLTPEQFKQYQANMEQMRKEKAQKGGKDARRPEGKGPKCHKGAGCTPQGCPEAPQGN